LADAWVAGHGWFRANAVSLRLSIVVLTDQTKSIDHIARHVRYIASAPAGLADAALEKIAAIFEH
jgi:hypothetical protein